MHPTWEHLNTQKTLKDIKGEIDSNTIIVGNFKTQLRPKKSQTNGLNNTFLNKQVTEEIKREIKKFLETNENENMRTQNL